MEVGRRGLLFGGVFYSFSPLGEWGSIIRGGRLFGRLEYTLVQNEEVGISFMFSG